LHAHNHLKDRITGRISDSGVGVWPNRNYRRCLRWHLTLPAATTVGYKVTEGSRTRVQNYEGVCIARKNGKGIAGSFTVRKISFGEGVERVFPLYSTNIDNITVVRRGRVRRAKLYYLRSRRGKSARIAEVTNYKAPKA